MDTAVVAALVIVVSLAFYVMLDGFDLGVGSLLLLERDERDRDLMVESISPVWDGNETWLVMVGVTLLGCFPIAYGVLLPAFYLPLVVMLVSLGFRGVAFEFRFQTVRMRAFWDAAFCGGSILAALCQGVVLGGVVQGIAVGGTAFVGGALDVFTLFSAFTGVLLLTGYAVLGAAWLAWRSPGRLRDFAHRRLVALWIPFGILAIVFVYWARDVSPAIDSRFSAHPGFFGSVLLIFVALWALGLRMIRRLRPIATFVVGLAMFGLGFVGLGAAVAPWAVPYRISVWDASSPSGSRLIVLVAVLVMVPIIVTYSAFAYWVFRGKTRDLEVGA